MLMMKHTSTPDPYIVDLSANKPSQTRSGADQPLLGLRLAVKDLFHIAGLPTSAGNPDWLNTHNLPDHTSPVITQLLDHGARLVGKTITDELAYSLNGQNIHYGTPVNPVCPDRLPGGSSSGSAVAVAQNSADIGLGTDTGGSIRVPSSYNGLFGLRPSHGLISVEHMVSLAQSFDTVGWITRDLATMKKVADVLLAELPSTTAERPTMSVGIANSLFDNLAYPFDLSALYHSDKFTVAELNEHITFDLLENANAIFRVLQGREIAKEHGAWVKATQPRFAPDIAQRFKWCMELSQREQSTAEDQLSYFQRLIGDLFKQHQILVVPTTPGPAPLLNMSEEGSATYRNKLLNMTSIAGLCGLPQLHLPLYKHEGAPYGISLIGQKKQDRVLISLANNIMDTYLIRSSSQ